MGDLLHQKSDVSLDIIRQVVGLIRKVATKLRGLGGTPSTAADPTCDSLAGLDRIPPITRGFVVRSGIGSYDCEVSIAGMNAPIVCSTVSPILSDIYGVSQACMPAPGSCVLVYVDPVGLSQSRPVRGFILGVIPDVAPHGTVSTDGGKVDKCVDTEFPEGGVAQFTESGPAAIASDKEFPYHGEFQFGRPHDMVPGEYGLVNHAGAGLVIGALSTTIKGSAMASVRCSALDDQVSVTSGHFRHISAAGSDEIFNDGGFITVESSVSMYQPERLGVKDAGTPAFTHEVVSNYDGRKSGVSPLKPSQTARKRFYRYAGYLGDIVNVFVASPDPEKDVEEMAAPGLDRGLMHYHVDGSGRLTIRAAAGVMLERYDRIPVPKRRHYAWDPAGNKEAGTPEKKTPFAVKGDAPMAIGLTLGDAAAWWDNQAYMRFRQFDKDFYVPDQKELKCPEDDYDKIGNASEQFQAYDTRHSYMGLTKNGGIVLRDAWGSEIIMADGRITFNAAANIEIRSGSSVVILGGDDVVAKAYNSVDISATKKDVRVKAENNLQVVSMKRGVLIQSKSTNDVDKSAWDKVGEDLVSGGVVIKADSSSVAVVGNRALVEGTTGVSVASFKDSKPNGNIVLAGRQVVSVATDSVVATVKGKSGISIDEQNASLIAPQAFMVGAQSAAQAAGNNMLLGIPIDVGSLYDRLAAVCSSQSQLYLDSLEWLSPFQPTEEVFSRVDFKFRTTEQYGTTLDSGFTGGAFSVYEPSWAVMAEAKRDPLKWCALQAWDEGKDAGNGCPWPGSDAMDADGYVTYREQNVTDAGIEQATKGEVELTRAPFSSYHIRKQS